MGKYIDTDAYVNAIKQSMHNFNGNPLVQYGLNLAIYCAINEMPAADVEPVRKWIPCSERLPEEPYGCLVYVEATDRYTGEDYTALLPRFAGYDGERWNDDDGQEVPFEVLAWWKLPEPPKMDGGSE